MTQAYYGLATGALWLAWVVYWSVAGRTVKPIARGEDRKGRARYGLPMIVGLLLLMAPGAAGPELATPLWPRTGLEGALAVTLVILGLMYSIWARVRLAGNWSEQPAVKEGHTLVTTGPYKWTRHPIYTGVLVALLGSFVLFDRWQAFLGYAIIVLAFVIKLRVEERFMEEQFGDAYRQYMRKVAALVPGLF